MRPPPRAQRLALVGADVSEHDHHVRRGKGVAKLLEKRGEGLFALAFAELLDDLSTGIVERAKDDELAILSSGGNPHCLSLAPPDLCQVRVGVDFTLVHIDQMGSSRGSKSSGSSGRK